MGNGTRLGRVRGLGSAKHGAHHWIVQRITAVGNLILVLWFVLSLLRMPDYGYDTVSLWLSNPISAVAMMLLLVSVFTHLRLGMQVMIEDYIHDHGSKIPLLLLVNFYAIAGAALGIFAVARIAFAGAPA